MLRKVLRANFNNALSATKKVQFLHSTSRNENMLIIGGAAAVAGAVTIRYAVSAYNSLPKAEPVKDGHSETVGEGQSAENNSTKDSGSSMFSSWFSKNYYEGGFEEKMTKREAALILGVRESTTGDRIKDAHRRILLLNHPDRGGSAYVAAKINEAKDLLIKGK